MLAILGYRKVYSMANKIPKSNFDIKAAVNRTFFVNKFAIFIMDSNKCFDLVEFFQIFFNRLGKASH